MHTFRWIFTLHLSSMSTFGLKSVVLLGRPRKMVSVNPMGFNWAFEWFKPYGGKQTLAKFKIEIISLQLHHMKRHGVQNHEDSIICSTSISGWYGRSVSVASRHSHFTCNRCSPTWVCKLWRHRYDTLLGLVEFASITCLHLQMALFLLTPTVANSQPVVDNKPNSVDICTNSRCNWTILLWLVTRSTTSRWPMFDMISSLLM